jgi:16S rRNA (guanine966-N2)-methyltransferase
MKIFGGTHKKRSLDIPRGLDFRPTSGMVREAFFNICQSYIAGAAVLDLFAGSGAIGIEALSRGAKRVTFVDSEKLAIRALKKNLANFGFSDVADVFCCDAITAIDRLERKFDIIYIDPPYAQDYAVQVLDKIGPYLNDGGYIFLEESKRVEISTTLNLVKKRKFGGTVLLEFSL